MPRIPSLASYFPWIFFGLDGLFLILYSPFHLQFFDWRKKGLLWWLGRFVQTTLDNPVLRTLFRYSLAPAKLGTWNNDLPIWGWFKLFTSYCVSFFWSGHAVRCAHAPSELYYPKFLFLSAPRSNFSLVDMNPSGFSQVSNRGYHKHCSHTSTA